MGKAVQYRGKQAILKCFDNTNIVAWGLLYANGKQFIGKHAGGTLDDSRQALEDLVKEMERSNTTAEYTLNFYEDVKDKRKIRLSLEPDISCNVVIFDNEDNPSPGSSQRRGYMTEIMERFEILEAKLALMSKEPEEDTDEEEEDAVGGIWGRVIAMANKILDNPVVQENVGNKFITWADKLFSPSIPPIMDIPTADAMGATGQPATGQPQITEEQAAKITNSLPILASVDPHLGDNLEKIALLAQQNPKKYRSLISMLNTFL